MHFKLIVIMVEDERTKDILHAAREAGATGCTVMAASPQFSRAQVASQPSRSTVFPSSHSSVPPV